MRISGIDVKLGLRMLIKHPALTMVGGLGMAVAVAISVGFFTVLNAYIYPSLPLAEGERIVALENRDIEINNEERRSLHDFFTWRTELTTVQDLAAFRNTSRLFVIGTGSAEQVEVAEMTAAGFRVARVPPLLGRYVVQEDERAGAPPVVVIGHDVWQNRFAGDPRIIGRTVSLGGIAHEVIGVMPAGFAFPMSHSFWTPLRADPDAHARREGPGVFIFGRLARGISMEQAQAELETVGRRAALDFPDTHAHLRPMVMPYVHSLIDVQGITFWEVSQMQLMMTLLLFVVCLNVAVLVYARTATRHGEIAVRCALGASRARIVAQLFVEALVLSLLAAGAGLAIAQLGVGLGFRILAMEHDGRMPFWTDHSLSVEPILFTAGLAILAAVIVGVLPALQATGRRLQSDLRQLGGGTGIRLGRTWTFLIVAQVGIAVAALPAAVNAGWNAIREMSARPKYAAEEFLAVSVSAASEEYDEDQISAPMGGALRELIRQLEAQPAVAEVTFETRLPDRGGRIEVEDVASAEGLYFDVPTRGVLANFFEVLDVPVLAGRSFTATDAADAAAVVVVNRAFVRQVLGGGEALGRRVRHVGTREDDSGDPGASAWFTIVGVVDDLVENPAAPDRVRPGIVYPVDMAQARYASLILRLRGQTPTEFAPRLRSVVASVDPTLRLGTVRSLADTERQARTAAQLIGLAVSLVLLSVFLLSAAGIYALVSFTVTQRRREIGIRSALGAQPMQVLRSIFARAVIQISAGLLTGVALALLAETASGGGLMGGRGYVILPVIGLTMAVVGLFAALGPARRGLRYHPTEALRADS